MSGSKHNTKGEVTTNGPEPDKFSGSTYDNYSILARPERDAPEQFQEGVIKLKNEFAVLDKEVRKGGGLIGRGIRIAISALAKMEPFLSRKGEHHEPHHVKMLIAAGLPTWDEYKKQVAAEFEISVRTVQRKLEEHRGHPKECQPHRLSDGNRSLAQATAQTAAEAIAAENLAEAEKKLGAAAALDNAEAAAIITEYETAITTADSSNLTNEDNSRSDGGVVIDQTASEFAGMRLPDEGILFDEPPLAENEKVATLPDRPGPSVSTSDAEPDWKRVLLELLQVLEESGDRLPLVVLKEKRKFESLLAGRGLAGQKVPLSSHRPALQQRGDKS